MDNQNLQRPNEKLNDYGESLSENTIVNSDINNTFINQSPAKNVKKDKLLPILLYVQIFSFILAYIILLSTKKQNNFSALAAIPPLVLSTLLAPITFILFLIYFFKSRSKSLSIRKHVIVLFIIAILIDTITVGRWGLGRALSLLIS